MPDSSKTGRSDGRHRMRTMRFGRFGRQFANRKCRSPFLHSRRNEIFTGQMLQLPILFFKFGKTSNLPHEKLLFILIGCVICPAVSAQSLYDLWRKAGKEMVKYSIYYSGTYDFQPGSEFPELKCDEHKGRWSPPLKHRKEYRHVSEEITRSGFDYDRQNDTLLFVFHHRYIWPSWVFVYTKNQQYAYIINARTKEAEKIDKPNRPWDIKTTYINNCLYYGQTEKLKTIFNQGGILWNQD